MSGSDERDLVERSREEPPPFLGTWHRVYIALLALLAGYIALFWFITGAYR